MIAEDYFTSDEIMEKIKKRVHIRQDWCYGSISLKQARYPNNYSNSHTMSCCLLVYPNETSEIMIQSLTSDNTGGGLNNKDRISFSIQYTTTTSSKPSKEHLFDVDLKDYPKYLFWDGQGIKHIFPINKSYKLSNINNYKDIRIFNIFILQSWGDEKGNECSLLINYTQN